MTEELSSNGPSGLTATLMPLITGFMASRVVHVAAELGIADLLAASAKSTDELAIETGAHASTLHRLLRALASLGIIDELEPGCAAPVSRSTRWANNCALECQIPCAI